MKIREITEYVTDYVHGDVDITQRLVKENAYGTSPDGISHR